MRLDRTLVPAIDEGALRLGELSLDYLRQATATLVSLDEEVCGPSSGS